MVQSSIGQDVARIRRDDLLREALSVRREPPVPPQSDRARGIAGLGRTLRSLQLPELRDYTPPSIAADSA